MGEGGCTREEAQLEQRRGRMTAEDGFTPGPVVWLAGVGGPRWGHREVKEAEAKKGLQNLATRR